MSKVNLIVKDKVELKKKLFSIATLNPSDYVFYKILYRNTDDETMEVEVENVCADLLKENPLAQISKFEQNGYELFEDSPWIAQCHQNDSDKLSNNENLKHSKVPNHREYLSTDKDEYEIKCKFAISIINEFTDMYNRGTLLCGENATSDDILSQIIGTIVKTAKLHKLTEEELK